MALMANFTPCATRSDATVSVGGTASTAAALPASGANGSFLAYNPTANVGIYAFGTSSVVATTSGSYIVPPGAIMLFGIPVGATHYSGIFLSSGTGTMYGVAGEGA